MNQTQSALSIDSADHKGESSDEPAISLSDLLKHAQVIVDGAPHGRVEDIIVRTHHNDFAQVTGVIVKLGKNTSFVKAASIVALESERIEFKSEKWDFKPFDPQPGEISLKADILCHRVVDMRRSALVKVYDVRLAERGGDWVVVALDVHRSGLFAFGWHAGHRARDWRDFLPIGRDANLRSGRSSPIWIGRLKPAQIADLIEAASADEQGHLLAQVHEDPELEADVFEELEEDRQAQVFKSLSDPEVADVLSRMRADDVADAVMELAQDRRQRVLDLLPLLQRTKVLTLLGYNKATAGGLMGTDFLALPEDSSVGDALQGVRDAKTHQPEALITIHCIGADGRLTGTLGLVQALQADPHTALGEIADRNIVAASPEDDIIAVTNRMADFNLLSLPVLDEDGMLIGIVTVDDALEAAIPKGWAVR